MSFRSSYNFVSNSTPPFTTSSSHDKEAIVLWVEVCGIYGVRECQLGISYRGSHLAAAAEHLESVHVEVE